MPLEPVDFPTEVQVAFFIFSFLSDVWDGMNGMYMGKDWSSVEYFFKTYEVENPRQVLYFMKMYERMLISNRADKAEQQRKAAERKAGGGKNYTHNVKG